MTGNPFDMSTWAAIIVAGVGVGYYMYRKSQNKQERGRDVMYGALLVSALILTGGSAGYFTAADTGINDVGDVSETGISTIIAQPVDTLTVIATDGMSLANDEVDGTINIYKSGTNPSDPLARTLDTITVSDGDGNSTDKKVQTNTDYVVGLSGSGYYDTMIGTAVVYPYIMDAASQQVTIEVITTKTGIIADPVDETETTDYFGSATTTYNTAANSVNASGSTITYNKTAGSDSFVHPMTISVSGGVAELKNAVLCPVWDTTNPPEGNEYSSIVATRLSGNDLGIPGNVLSYWSTQTCIPLGDIPAGSYSKYNFAYTVAESNVDSNDDWKWAIDDMGDYLGKDIFLGTKASAQTENIDHTT